MFLSSDICFIVLAIVHEELYDNSCQTFNIYVYLLSNVSYKKCEHNSNCELKEKTMIKMLNLCSVNMIFYKQKQMLRLNLQLASRLPRQSGRRFFMK